MGAQQSSVYKTKYSTDAKPADPVAAFVTDCITQTGNYFRGGEVTVDAEKIDKRRSELQTEINETFDKYMNVLPDEEDSDFYTVVSELKQFTNAKAKLYLMIRLFLSLYRAVQVLTALDAAAGSVSTLSYHTVEEMQNWCTKRVDMMFDAYVLTLLLDKLDDTWKRFMGNKKTGKQIDLFILLVAHVQPLHILVEEDAEVLGSEVTSQTILNYFVNMFGQLVTLREVSNALDVLSTRGKNSQLFKSALSQLSARLVQFVQEAKRQKTQYISNTIYETLHVRFQENEARVPSITHARPVVFVITTHGSISKPTTALLSENVTLARVAHAAPGRSASYGTPAFQLLISAIRVQGPDLNATSLLQVVQATVGSSAAAKGEYSALQAHQMLMQENNIAVRHFPGERYLNKVFSLEDDRSSDPYDWAITALYNGQVINVLAALGRTTITSQELIDYARSLQQPPADIANIIMLDFSCSNFEHAERKVRYQKVKMEMNVKLKRQRLDIEDEEAIERKRAKQLMLGIAGGWR